MTKEEKIEVAENEYRCIIDVSWAMCLSIQSAAKKEYKRIGRAAWQEYAHIRDTATDD